MELAVILLSSFVFAGIINRINDKIRNLSDLGQESDIISFGR